MFHLMLQTFWLRSLNLNRAGKLKHQVTSLHFYSCFLFVGRHGGRFCAEVSLTHCWNELGRNTPAILHPQCQLFWAESYKSSFPCWIGSGKLGQLSVCLKPFGPNTPFSLFVVMNNLLRTFYSSGNMITELSGLEKTSWGHVAPSGNPNTWDSSISSLGTKLLVNDSHVLYSHPVHSESVFYCPSGEWIIQWHSFLLWRCVPLHELVCADL